MASRMQQADSLFRDYLNEHSHLKTKDDSSPLYSNPTLIYPNIIQPQQTIAYPTFQQQPQPLTFDPKFTQPTLKQPLQNSQHIYDAKKSGIVNEIINTINNQHQKVLESVSLNQEKLSKFNYYHDLIIRKCEMMNDLEEKYKKHYCNLEKKLNNKFAEVHDIKGRIYNIETYQKIILEQQYRIKDLVKFIYNYLNGKKKKNYLKKAMLKILGNDNCDLRKYKLERAIQLEELYALSKDIGTKSNASSGIDPNDSEKTPTFGDNIIKINKNDNELKSKEIKLNNNSLKSSEKEKELIKNKDNKQINLLENIQAPMASAKNESKEKELTAKEKFEKKTNEIIKKKSKQSFEIIEAPTINHNKTNTPKKNTAKTNKPKTNKKQQKYASKRTNKQNNNNNNKKRLMVKQKKKKKQIHKKNFKTKIKIKNAKNINNNNLKDNNIKEKPPDNPLNGDPSGPFWQEQLENYGYTEDYQEVYKYYKPKASIKDYFESIELLEEIYYQHF